MLDLERILLWGARISLFLMVTVPIIVTSSMLFPFVSGKNFFFRLIAGIAISCWVALAVLNKKYRPKRQPLSIALLVFFSAVVVSTIFGADPYNSFWSNFERMEGVVTYIYLLGLFFVAGSVLNTKELWIKLLGASVAVSLISAFWGFLQSTGTIAMVAPGRPYAGFGNSIYLAVHLLFHIFILGLVLPRVRVNWQRILVGAALFFEIYVFFLSASRGAFLGAIAGILTATFLMAVFYRSKKAILAFSGAFGLALIILILIVVFPNSSLVKNVTLLDRLASIPFSDISQDARVMVWGVGWDAFLARPVLGWGPGNFIVPFPEFYNPNLFGQEPWFDRTHNMFLEWLVTTGIVGFIAYMGVIVTSFFAIFKLYIREKIDIPTGAFLAGFFVAYLVQNIFVFDTIGTYIVIFLLWSLLYSLHGHNEEVVENKREEEEVPSGKIFLAVAGALLVGVFTLFISIKPILASQQLIDGLKAFPEGKPADEVIKKFDKALEFDTFANTEIKERFSTVVFDLARNLQQFTPQFLLVNNKAIEYFEQEIIERPEQLRGLLFLAQLKAINATATGTNFDDAEDLYKEAIVRAPNYVQTYLSLASLYLIQGENSNAIAQAQAVEGLNISRTNIVAPILNIYVSAGDLEGGMLFLQNFFEGEHYGGISAGGLNSILINTANKFTPTEQIEFFTFIDEVTSENEESEKVILYLVTAQAYGELRNFDKAEEYANKAKQFESPYTQQIEDFLRSIKVLRG